MLASSRDRSKAVGDLKCVGEADDAALIAVESEHIMGFLLRSVSVSNWSKLLSFGVHIYNHSVQLPLECRNFLGPSVCTISHGLLWHFGS